MEDILEDLLIIADRLVAEFLLETLLPQSLPRLRLNDDRECRLKSFLLMPFDVDWLSKARFVWHDISEMKLPPDATERRSKALTIEMQSSLSSSTSTWEKRCRLIHDKIRLLRFKTTELTTRNSPLFVLKPGLCINKLHCCKLTIFRKMCRLM